MIRALFVEWSERFHIKLAEEASSAGWRIVGWTGDPRSGIDFERIRTIWPKVEIRTTAQALCPPVDGLPEPELRAKLYECESIVLKMMNRVDYRHTTVAERQTIYLRMVSYWHKFLIQTAPEVVIFSITPHMVYDHVIYSLCRVMGIRTLLFSYTRFPGRVLLMDDYKQGDTKVAEVYKAISNVSTGDLSPEIRSYFEKTFASGSPPSPKYMEKFSGTNRSKASFRQFVRRFRKWLHRPRLLALHPISPIEARFMPFVWERKKRRLRKEHDGCVDRKPLNRPYVYFPLHYQPERSTSPLADVYVDQDVLIAVLTSALPAGWDLVVKEHPRQLFPGGTHAHQGREEGFYQKITANPSVRLVDLETPSIMLLRGCSATVTLTGTAGWEGLALGKPALVFGYAWYMDAPGVFRLRGLEDCREVLRNIEIGNSVPPSTQAIISYHAAIDRRSVRGYVDSSQEDLCEISPKEAMGNIFRSIAMRVESAMGVIRGQTN